MKCQELNSFLSFEAWRFCINSNYTAWVHLRCDNLFEGIVKINVANNWSLVDFCQFCNVSIDFVKYLTASKSNVKIIIFATC